jgi:hypothetical protein
VCAVEDELCLLEVLEALEVMRCVQFCVLEAVEVGSVYWRCWRSWRCRKWCAVCHSLGVLEGVLSFKVSKFLL